MARASRTGEKEKGLSHEIAGIALIALALYAGVSVFSPLSGEQWGGVAGSFISGLAFAAVGYASYILPLFLLVTGFKLLLRRALTISVFAPISIGVFMAAGSALMAMVGGAGTGAGGMAGEAMTLALDKYAGRTGSLVVLVSLIVASVLAFSGISRKKRAPAATDKKSDAAPHGAAHDYDDEYGPDNDDGYND